MKRNWYVILMISHQYSKRLQIAPLRALIAPKTNQGKQTLKADSHKVALSKISKRAENNRPQLIFSQENLLSKGLATLTLMKVNRP